MEQTELKLVENGTCCGGKACESEMLTETKSVVTEEMMAASAAAVTEMTKEKLIEHVLELSMTVNRLNTEIGAMAKGVQNMVAEMYQAMIGEIEAIKKSINPQ